MEPGQRERFAGLRLSGETRRAAHLGDEMIVPDGRTYLPSIGAVRQLSDRLQKTGRAAWRAREQPTAGQWNALRLLDLATRVVYERQRQRRGQGVARVLLEALDPPERTSLMRAFLEESPPQEVLDGRRGLDVWLANDDERRRMVRELLFVSLIFENRAARHFQPYLGSGTWSARLSKPELWGTLVRGEHPGLDASAYALIEELRAPLRASPDDLEGQLRWIGEHWAGLLPDDLLAELLLARDVLREERRLYAGHGGGGRPTSEVYRYDALPDVERFSADSPWMPRCVLLARNARVWLAQLSRRFGRSITRLDAIPDEALVEIAERGINALWLIGVWERSEASAVIKRRMGDHNAVASAYSLYDYRIADELGGEEAFARLKDQAARFGMRLAADMVPNHVGIVSKWVYEHPDWFVSVRQPPFPNYRFTGPDLSPDPRYTIQIEDHYWDRSDAAVVFRRHDHHSGDERFIYHGNDGTSMPWNDTAQIDYLNPEAREAVIQTILDVARRCPIIRFDAAMTLVKRHVQRLWYPQPGHGGAIPSRAEHGLTQEQFDAAMPREFWTEVVERVQQEVPDTLLLAEAFWMMEGYFVRNLGMHRVYNSAFMNMLRDEDNAGYRELMRNTLEYDPQILERFVNFMNNPDEDTAIAQFGRGDKYFGVCTLMCTMPGLPMIGHGQVEGLTEKYGMDFAAPRIDEQPDEGLVAAHRHRIFPLLHRRALFAGVDNFRLFDARAHGSDATVEDVFAYTNRRGDERALVVYLNRFSDARVRVEHSVAWSERTGADTRALRSESLVAALGLPVGDDLWVRFRDQVSGLSYLRATRRIAEAGLDFSLGAYGCQVLLDWEVLHDVDGRWSTLATRIGEAGVPDLDREAMLLRLGPLHHALREAIDAAVAAPRTAAPDGVDADEAREAWLRALADVCGVELAAPADDADESVELADENTEADEAEEGDDEGVVGGEGVVSDEMEAAGDEVEPAAEAASVVELDGALARVLAAADLLEAGARACGRDEAHGFIEEFALAEVLGEDTALVQALLALGDEVYGADDTAQAVVRRWFDEPRFRRLVGVHDFDGVRWFRREPFERWLHVMRTLAIDREALWDEAAKIAEAAGWKVDALLGEADEA